MQLSHQSQFSSKSIMYKTLNFPNPNENESVHIKYDHIMLLKDN